MAPRKMKQVAQLKPKVLEKNRKERLQVKRVKAEMGQIKDSQNCVREEQRIIRVRFRDIQKQRHQLKVETETIIKRTAMTRIKIVLMFKILKAREGGDFIQAAKLTRFLRVFVAKERANASLAEVKNENPQKKLRKPQEREPKKGRSLG